MGKRFNFAHRIDDATDLDGLKNRLRSVLQNLESVFESGSSIYFIDAKTNSNPSQYKRGDILIDISLIPGYIAIYGFDGKNKLPISLRSLSGDLPFARNETFSGDGSNKNFNTQFPFVKNSTQVFKAGSRQTLGIDYSENAGTFKQVQFVAAPASGNKIVIDYTIIPLS